MKKVVWLVLVALLIVGGTIGAYAYWDNLEQTKDETLTIGQGVTLVVAAVAEAPEGKVLVPAGVVMKANDVDEIVLTYNVKLDLAALAALDLSVVESDVLIGESDTYATLVNIDIVLASDEVNAENVLVTITVTLSEPGTSEIYDAIKGQDITFTLTFTAEQAIE
ncbi:MAG: hypothetical protein PHO96_05820 [Candidatus Izemoplasmatales bacterium]|nr:hypothetical protein [Candidatus Izemoplasmatales bacterium]